MDFSSLSLYGIIRKIIHKPIVVDSEDTTVILVATSVVKHTRVYNCTYWSVYVISTNIL